MFSLLFSVTIAFLFTLTMKVLIRKMSRYFWLLFCNRIKKTTFYKPFFSSSNIYVNHLLYIDHEQDSTIVFCIKSIHPSIFYQRLICRFSVCPPSLFPLLHLKLSFVSPPADTPPQHPPTRGAGGSIVWPVLTLFHRHITQPAFHSSNSAATITHSRLKKKKKERPLAPFANQLRAIWAWKQ